MFKKIGYYFKEYFTFNRRERNGLIVLALILVSIVLFNIYVDYKYSQRKYTHPEIVYKIDSTLLANKTLKRNTKKPYSDIEFFTFDPNTLSIERWKELGLSEAQARTILNYRNKGGYFKNAADLKKIYVINDLWFSKAKPYISIPQKKRKLATKKKVIKPKPKAYIKKSSKHESVRASLVVYLNSADTTELKKLKGIGSTFAKRIVKYRELLGGYYSKKQLLEVYGMDSVRYHNIKDNILVYKDSISKIEINTGEFKRLLAHPYLSYEDVKSIFNYRRNHGFIQSLEQLKAAAVLADSSLRRVSPYFDFR